MSSSKENEKTVESDEDEDYRRKKKRPRSSEKKSFSDWTWDEVEEHFKISNFGLECFSLKRKPFPDRNLVETVNEWTKTEDVYGACASAKNESTRTEFISTVLKNITYALNDREVRIFKESGLKHPEAASHGKVEFVLQHKTAGRYLLVVEAKQSDFQQGKAQNILELECARKIQNGGTVHGVVTNGISWIVLKHDEDDKFQEGILPTKSSSFIDIATHSPVALKESLGILCEVLFEIMSTSGGGGGSSSSSSSSSGSSSSGGGSSSSTTTSSTTTSSTTSISSTGSSGGGSGGSGGSGGRHSGGGSGSGGSGSGRRK